MLRQAFPIDSHVEFEADGTPVYDRAITSAPLRKFIKSLATDGVLPNPSTNLQVSAGTGMNVLVEAGFALCNGCMALEESQRTLAVQAADTSYDRIDTVVIRLNDNDSERTCDLYVLQGVPASSPIRPTLTRTESIWEIGLADLFITPNSSEITNQRITDTRYETERCGVISAISEFDTTAIYNQVQADLAGFKEEEQAQFIEWFEYMKDQLSEDAAGNLQLQIDETNEKVGLLDNLTTAVKTSIVAALNWIVEQINGLNSKIDNFDLSGKQDKITGAGTSIISNDLTPTMAMVTTSTGKIGVSSKVTSAELNYLDGVTSNIQAQLNNKSPLITMDYFTKSWSFPGSSTTNIVYFNIAKTGYSPLGIIGFNVSTEALELIAVDINSSTEACIVFGANSSYYEVTGDSSIRVLYVKN